VTAKGRLEAVAFVDATHGTGMDDKTCIFGVFVQMMGGPISSASRRQSVTSTSTMESEFKDMSETAREWLWIAKILEQFEIEFRSFLICGDSQGAIGALCYHQYTRHTYIEIHHDFMRICIKMETCISYMCPGMRIPPTSLPRHSLY
jgi:hypothetical protein